MRSSVPFLWVLAGCGTQWLDIDVGLDHVCGIQANGPAWCWGSNDEGELGAGDLTRPAPGAVPNPSRVTRGGPWRDIAATATGTCAIDADGALWCWGVVGDEAPHVEPSSWDDGPWEALSGGHDHWCAIGEDATLACWGWNTRGQLGIGPPGCNGLDDPGCQGVPEQTTPREPTEPGPWVAVAAGTTSTCAIKADGSLWCAGTNRQGELGTGVATCNPDQTPCPENPGVFARAGDRTDWAAVTVGNQNACALDTDGRLWCWGDNRGGALGTGDAEMPVCGEPDDPSQVCSPTPLEVGDATWLEVDLGASERAWAVRDDGTLWSWGVHDTGSLTSPTAMDLGDDWTAVRSGSGLACGLKTDASAWCWGRNDTGALGDGTLIDRPAPVEIGVGW